MPIAAFDKDWPEGAVRPKDRKGKVSKAARLTGEERALELTSRIQIFGPHSG